MEGVNCDFSAEVGHCGVAVDAVEGFPVDLVLGVAFLDVGGVGGRGGGFGAVAGELGEAGGAGGHC